jgi:hypothetical protein
VVRGIDDEGDRDRALAALGQVEEALEVARGIGREGHRASALEALATRLAQAGRLELAVQAAGGIGHEWYRARALKAVATRLLALPPAEVLPLWVETLRLCATRSRRDLLADLAALAPVIAALGGPEAIEETCRAIEDVGRWWP